MARDIFFVKIISFVFSDPGNDTLNQYTKRMQFLKGFLNTKEIVIHYCIQY